MTTNDWFSVDKLTAMMGSETGEGDERDEVDESLLSGGPAHQELPALCDGTADDRRFMIFADTRRLLNVMDATYASPPWEEVTPRD